jgi:hypothetical protein
MIVVGLLSMLGISTGRRRVSLVRLRAATGGDGRGPGAEWLSVENLVIRLVGIACKVGIAPCGFNLFVSG